MSATTADPAAARTGVRLLRVLRPEGADDGALGEWLAALAGAPWLPAHTPGARALQAWPDAALPPALAEPFGLQGPPGGHAAVPPGIVLSGDLLSTVHTAPVAALWCRPGAGFARLWRGAADWQLRRLPRLLAWAEAADPWLAAALQAETDPYRQYRRYWRAWMARLRRQGHPAWPDSDPAGWPAAWRERLLGVLGLPDRVAAPGAAPARHEDIAADEAAQQQALDARLDQALAQVRPLLGRLDAVRDALRSLHQADPLALALELTRLLRADADSHHALVALLPASGLLQAGDALPLQLAVQMLDPADASAQDRVAGLLGELPPLAAAKLFRHPAMPRNVALLQALARRVLHEPAGLALAPAAWFNLLVLGYAAFEPPLFEALLQRLRAGVGRDALSRQLQDIAGRFRPGPVPPVQAAPRQPAARPLRVALCLSGQLRGWRHALPTWSALALDGHDVDVYVHTWRRVGMRVPDPAVVRSMARVFGPGAFAEAFLQAARRHGMAALAQAYPALLAALQTGETVDEPVLRAALQARFGGRVHIVVEDDDAPAFAGWSNQDRMHYKLWAAHRLARDRGVDYDLMLRLRPDKTLAAGPAGPDWPALVAHSRAHGTLFCEAPLGLREGLVMGDQFAAGAPEVMDAYAAAWTLTPQARREHWPGFPTRFVGHGSLAWTCLWQGLRPQRLPGPEFGPIAEDQPLRGATLRTLLAADMPQGPRDARDRALCAALEVDPT